MAGEMNSYIYQVYFWICASNEQVLNPLHYRFTKTIIIDLNRILFPQATVVLREVDRW